MSRCCELQHPKPNGKSSCRNNREGVRNTKDTLTDQETTSGTTTKRHKTNTHTYSNEYKATENNYIEKQRDTEALQGEVEMLQKEAADGGWRPCDVQVTGTYSCQLWWVSQHKSMITGDGREWKWLSAFIYSNWIFFGGHYVMWMKTSLKKTFWKRERVQMVVISLERLHFNIMWMFDSVRMWKPRQYLCINKLWGLLVPKEQRDKTSMNEGRCSKKHV